MRTRIPVGWRQHKESQELAAALLEGLDLPGHSAVPYYIQARLDEALGPGSRGERCQADVDGLVHQMQVLMHDLTADLAAPLLSRGQRCPNAIEAHDRANFAASLLHTYLALTWAPLWQALVDLGCPVDDLAAASVWRLSTEEYAAVLEALGMEHMLLELLSLIRPSLHPAPVSPGCMPQPTCPQPQHLLAQLLQARPALSVGMLAALCPPKLGACGERGRSFSQDSERPGCVAEEEVGLLLLLAEAARSLPPSSGGCSEKPAGGRPPASLSALAASVQRLRCCLSLCLAAQECLQRRLPDAAAKRLLLEALGSLEVLLGKWQGSLLDRHPLAPEEAFVGGGSLAAEQGRLQLVALSHLQRLSKYLSPDERGAEAHPAAAASLLHQRAWQAADLDAALVDKLQCRLKPLLAAGVADAGRDARPGSAPQPPLHPLSCFVHSVLLTETAGWLGSLGDGPDHDPLLYDPMLSSICADPCRLHSADSESSAGSGSASPAWRPSQWPGLPGLQPPPASLRAMSRLMAAAAAAVAAAELMPAPAPPFVPSWLLRSSTGAAGCGAVWCQRLAGIAVGALTPGLPCPWRSLSQSAVEACRGTDPYGPLSCSLAALELAAADAPPSSPVASCGPSSGLRRHGTGLLPQPGLSRLILHMAAAALARLKQARRQQALLQAVASCPHLLRLLELWARDEELQAGASRIIVAASNRMVVVPELQRSGGVVLGQREADDLAAAAVADLLPAAVVAPMSLLRRLVDIAVHHPGQQPLVLELLLLLAPIATSARIGAMMRHAPNAAPSTSGGPPSESAVAVAARDVLIPACPPAVDGLSEGTEEQLLARHHSKADQAAFLQLCSGLDGCGLLGRDEQLRDLAGPVLQACVRRRAGHSQQAHTALMLVAEIVGLQSKSLAQALGGPGAPRGPACRASELASRCSLLLLLSGLVDPLWSGASPWLQDSTSLELGCSVIEHVVADVRKQALSAWPLLVHEAGIVTAVQDEEARRSSEAGSGPLHPPQDGPALQARRLLQDLELLVTEAARGLGPAAIMVLLPCLEAGLGLFLRHIPATTAALLPPSVWRGARLREPSAAAASVVLGRLADMMLWIGSADTHATLMSDLLLSQAEEDEEEGRAPPRDDDDETAASPPSVASHLAGTARNVCGTMFRTLSSCQATKQLLPTLLVPALALRLPSASAKQAHRILSLGLPALVRVFAAEEAGRWCSAWASRLKQTASEPSTAGGGQVQWIAEAAGAGSGQASAQSAAAAAAAAPAEGDGSEPPRAAMQCSSPLSSDAAGLPSLLAAVDAEEAFGLHVLFEAVGESLVSGPGAGEGWSGCAQACADRCCMHASVHVQRVTAGRRHGSGDYGGDLGAGRRSKGWPGARLPEPLQARRGWLLSLVALSEACECYARVTSSAFGSSCDMGTLLVLMLSLVRSLCTPPVAAGTGSSGGLHAAAVPSLGCGYLAVLTLVPEAWRALGACPAALQQVRLVASKSVEDHVAVSLGLYDQDDEIDGVFELAVNPGNSR